MRCSICGQEKLGVFCACGYCKDCIKKFTHEGCHEIEQKRLKKEKKK